MASLKNETNIWLIVLAGLSGLIWFIAEIIDYNNSKKISLLGILTPLILLGAAIYGIIMLKSSKDQQSQ